MNKQRIEILPQQNEPFSIPLDVKLSRFYGLRFARKQGDKETVNHYQLGKLKQYNVKFKTL